MLTIIIT